MLPTVLHMLKSRTDSFFQVLIIHIVLVVYQKMETNQSKISNGFTDPMKIKFPIENNIRELSVVYTVEFKILSQYFYHRL
jgi:hypothetical protein